MQYIEFGKNHDVVWVMDNEFRDGIVRALKLRGFTEVSSHQPIESTDVTQGPWDENRYLDPPFDPDGNPNRPNKVHVIRTRTKPLNPNDPIAASSSERVAFKVVEALDFTFPFWTTEVVETEPPE